MLHVQLDPETERDLDFWARKANTSMSELASKAILDMIEELECIALLEQAKADPDSGQTIPHEQMIRELGLDA